MNFGYIRDKYKYFFIFFISCLFSFNSYSEIKEKPYIAIIIDDLGYKPKEDMLALSLPGPITYAILPHSPYANKISEIAFKNKKQILLHQPMQALTNNDLLGPGALTLNMTKKEFSKILKHNINSLPNIIGINNHMGSLLTRHPGHMKWLMDIISKYDYIYVDSLTGPNSVAGKIAKQNGVPFISRDIFLDNQKDKNHINKKIFELVNIAKKQGTALAICHPYNNTIEALSNFLKDINKHDVKLVGIKSLIKKRTRKNSLITKNANLVFP
ncbi:MAG: hypothetical protein CMF54_00640 [Legionellales bacterium]|nr:hypothetical protein [Legionellales bacterium]|tara:strand:- start:1897 stop:2706 length:810 start_codon:yes stop_codon:yes gene_type:complete